MVDLAPMHGLRYSDTYADERVYAPPYDVIDPERRRRLLDKSPYNMVRLILGGEPGNIEWHARAAETMARWIAEGVLVRDRQPALYGYRQHFRDANGRPRVRTGVMGRVRLSPWGGPIHRHEHTRIEPRLDRLRLTRAVRANLSPVFGLYRDPGDDVRHLLVPPQDDRDPDLLVDLVDEEGVRHLLWRIADPSTIGAVTTGLASREVIVADGHHRYETALAYQLERREASGNPTGVQPYDYVLMYLAAVEDPGLCILPAHRIVRVAKGLDPERVLAVLRQDFEVSPVSVGVRLSTAAAEAGNHAVAIGVCFGPDSQWVLRLKERSAARRGPSPAPGSGLAETDVSVLQNLILERHLGIDKETLARTERVTYTTDEDEACACAARGEGQVAFILNATPIEQVWAAAERGLTMPQKSTYFHPKLLSGLVMNPLDDA